MSSLRIVPSEIVKFIDRTFPAAEKDTAFMIAHNHAQTVQALMRMLDLLDPLLLPASGDDLVCFVASAEAIRNALEQWPTRGSDVTLKKVPGFGDRNPVTHLRMILAGRPDSTIPPETAGLEFIKDVKYRDSLRADVAALTTLTATGQWKAVMVIAGSLLEALLYYRLSTVDPEQIKATIELVARDGLRKPSLDLTRWHLPDYTRVAGELSIMKKSTMQQCLLTADFRNLVHPGKEIRENTRCTRGSALVAVGAV